MARRTPKTRRRPARPAHRQSKYTPEAVEKICAAIVTGDTIEEACKRVGISRETFYQWHRTKPDVSDKVQVAKDARLYVLEERWAKASVKDWRAAEAMLRVLKPKKFAQRLNVHIETELTAVIARVKEAFKDDPEQLERALAALAGESGPGGTSGDEGGSNGSPAQPSGEAVHPPPAE